MDLRRLTRLLTTMLFAVVLSAAPAAAHGKKHHPPPAATTTAAANSATGPATAAAPSTGHMEAMEEHMDEMTEDRSKMSTGARILDWLGRLHPSIIHFPLAFFPAALFTAIVGRRRPAFGKPIQFLVVAGGIIAPIAAALGWLDAVGADPDPLLTVHRWLGTAVGLGGAALAAWAWRNPEEDRSPLMVVSLALITAAIIVQGWYGGAMVHGMDHMNW